MIDDPADAVACRTAREPMEVVEDQHDFALICECVHEPAESGLQEPRIGDELGRDRLCESGRGPAQRLDDVCPESDDVVVLFVDGHPREPFPRRLDLAPRCEQGGLPATRWSRNEGELATRRISKTVGQPLTLHRVVTRRRRVELGHEHWRRGCRLRIWGCPDDFGHELRPAPLHLVTLHTDPLHWQWLALCTSVRMWWPSAERRPAAMAASRLVVSGEQAL